MLRAVKPRVVLFSAFVSPLRSGAEACAEEVAARLQDRYDITIIAARMRSDLPIDDTLPSGVRVKRVGFGMQMDKWLYPFLAPAAAAAMQPQIIHAVLESFAGLALVFSKNFVPKAKRILTCQSTNTTLFLRAMHRSADVVTAISSVLVERAKGFRRNAVLIPNGIRVAELQAAKEERVPGRILFVGRLEPMKGVDTLLEAFAVMVRRAHHDSVHLRIVGDGSERARLERQAADLGIADRVTFVGKVAHDAVAHEYAQAEIFCGLSRSEALGNVFLEAQAAGCAVVATNVGGIPDIVRDGVTGILVPPNNAEAAASTITHVLDNQTYHQALASAGRQNAENYDWKSISNQYDAIYQSCLLEG